MALTSLLVLAATVILIKPETPVTKVIHVNYIKAQTVEVPLVLLIVGCISVCIGSSSKFPRVLWRETKSK